MNQYIPGHYVRQHWPDDTDDDDSDTNDDDDDEGPTNVTTETETADKLAIFECKIPDCQATIGKKQYNHIIRHWCDSCERITQFELRDD